MIDIYGQHEHRSLLNPVKHIRLLDRFCGAGFGEAMEEYKNSRQRLKDLEKQLAILIGDESQREQRMDMLLFQKEEIEAAGLREARGCPYHQTKKHLGNVGNDTADGRKRNTSVMTGMTARPLPATSWGMPLRNYGKRRNMMRLCLPWRMHWRMAMLPWRTARGN